MKIEVKKEEGKKAKEDTKDVLLKNVSNTSQKVREKRRKDSQVSEHKESITTNGIKTDISIKEDKVDTIYTTYETKEVDWWVKSIYSSKIARFILCLENVAMNYKIFTTDIYFRSHKISSS